VEVDTLLEHPSPEGGGVKKDNIFFNNKERNKFSPERGT
jgi:hypothetical protein